LSQRFKLYWPKIFDLTLKFDL